MRLAWTHQPIVFASIAMGTAHLRSHVEVTLGEARSGNISNVRRIFLLCGNDMTLTSVKTPATVASSKTYPRTFETSPHGRMSRRGIRQLRRMSESIDE